MLEYGPPDPMYREKSESEKMFEDGKIEKLERERDVALSELETTRADLLAEWDKLAERANGYRVGMYIALAMLAITILWFALYVLSRTPCP